tara:strand:+ start:330 stop:515 length:186 start_codon:yes stop_codon:yes gene_type:complete
MVKYVYNAEKGSTYGIEEQETGLKIMGGLSHEEAKKKKRFLNFGGGFNGCTPAFLLERIKR